MGIGEWRKETPDYIINAQFPRFGTGEAKCLLTDSVRTHLQEYIIRYRTSKARLDVEHYEDLVKRSREEYEKAVARYSRFCDANQEVVLQTYISQRDQLENEMQIKYNIILQVPKNYISKGTRLK